MNHPQAASEFDNRKNSDAGSSSAYPALEKLSAQLVGHGAWLNELARWYESGWQLALSGGHRPNPEPLVRMLTTDQRDELLSVLSSIDSHYTSLIGTAVKGNEPQAAIDLPPTKVSSTPHVAAGMDETIGVAGDPTDNQQTVDLPKVADATFDFSVNDATNKKSGPTGSSRVYGKAAAKPSAPQIPGYRIQRVLGRGGMGIVYLAHQAGIDRPVALKMVLAGAHASKTTFERFLAEARAVGRFQHENIVRIYDIGWHDDLPYFSLEYIDGPSLSEKIGGQPLDPVEAAKLLTPLARALGYAHRAGVVHRDLKPGNVLLTTDGVPKLSDFGLAKQLEEGNEFSHTGDIVGTPGYMAPEQARGESTVGAPADIYGLGGVLYCMLTGRPPFLAAKISDTLLQLLEEEPVPPTRLQPGVPLDLQTICLKCLQKEPAQRYLTAEELAEDLERFSRGEPIMARPISRVERAWRWSRRKPRQAALIGAASFMGAMLMIGGPIVAGVIYQQKQEVIKAKNDIEIKEKEATVARGEAEKNAKVAQTNEKLANDNAALAKKNADEAKQNAEAAQTQEKNAVDALKSLVFEVQRRMQDQPRLQAVRTALLKVASDGVKRMEESGGNVAAQNIITASIERRMGDLNMELGRIQSAHDNYQKCLTILVKLQQEKQLPGARHNLSTAYELLGVSSRRMAKLTDARRYLEQCLEERRQWVKEEPNDENVRQNVAATLGMLGTLAQEQGDLVAAKNFLEEGAKLREEYRAARPNDLNRQLQVIGAQWALADLTFQEGNLAEARVRFAKIVEQQAELVKRVPTMQSLGWNLGKIETNQAKVELYDGDFKQSAIYYTAARDRLKKLADEDPENLRLKESLADALYGLAVASQELGDQVGANEAFAATVEIRRVACQVEPDNLARQIRMLLALARSNLLKEAIPIAEAMRKKLGTDGGNHFHAACIYAQLSDAAKRGGELPEGHSADSLLAASRDFIKSARELGFDRPMDLKSDPDLKPLRE